MGVHKSSIASVSPRFKGLQYSAKAEKLIFYRISEMATVVIVGCCPSMPRLIHHIRGRDSSASGKHPSYESANSHKYGNKMLGSLAKYMTPGMVSSFSNEHLELHNYPVGDFEHGRGASAEGSAKTALVEQSVVKPAG